MITEATKAAFHKYLLKEGVVLSRAQSDELLTDLVKLLRLVCKQEI